MKFFPGLEILKGTSAEASIFNETIKVFKEIDLESSGGRYIKYPEQTRVLRGKGTFETKSNFDGEEEFELTFSADEKRLVHFLKIYHLACTLGVIHMQDWSLFKTFFDHHISSLEQKANLTFFDVSKPAGETSTGVKSKNKKFFEDVRKACDGNFMVLLKNFRINTLPETTNAYKITITVIPYMNCISFIMRNPKFYENFYTELNKNYSSKIAAFFKEIDDDYTNKDNKNFKFKFVNKNIVPSGEHIVKSDIDLLGTIEFELDSKFVDNFEIILNNNILKVPMQNAEPQFQNLGKAESSVTINMNFARSDLKTSIKDSFNSTIANLKTFTKMDQRDYYFEPVPEQHFLIKALRLSSFSMQGLTNNDIESDEFQMSNISVLLLANSYGIDESFQNVSINDSKAPDQNLYRALSGFNYFLGFFSKRIDNKEKVLNEIKRVKMLDKDLYFLIKASANLFPPSAPKGTFVYYTPNDNEVNQQKSVSVGDIISPYQSSLIHAVSLFTEKSADYNDNSITYKFAYENLYYFPIYYVKGSISSPDSPEYTIEGFLNFHIFRAMMLSLVRQSPTQARKASTAEAGINVVRNTFFQKDEKITDKHPLYEIAMSGIIAEYGNAQMRDSDKSKIELSFKNKMIEQIKVFKLSFQNTFGAAKNDSSKTGYKNTLMLVDLHKNITDLYFKLNYKVEGKIAERLKALKISMNYLAVLYSGFWPSSNNHLGRYERSLAESFANMVSVPLNTIFSSPTYAKSWANLELLFGKNNIAGLRKTVRANNQIDFNINSDANPIVGGEKFWNNAHISDLFDIALDAYDKKNNSGSNIIRSLAQSMQEKTYYSDGVKTEVNGVKLDAKMPEKTFESTIEELFKNFGYIYTNTFDEADYMRYELGWNKSVGKLVDLMERDYQNILPIYHVEFANVDFITGLLNETPFMSMEKSGYSGKIVSVVTNTNRTTKIKTAVIRMVDVENVMKAPTIVGGNMTVGASDTVSKKGTKVFNTELMRKAFPIKMGTLIRVYLGGSHKDVKNIFNGTVKSVEFDNGFITVTCANFASDLYNGDVKVAAGKGGIGIFGTVASFKNIKNILLDGDVGSAVKYGSDYKEVLKRMLNSNSGLNMDKIAFPIVDVNEELQESSAQFLIGLTCVVYENSLPFLTTNNFSSFNDNAVLSALKRYESIEEAKNLGERFLNMLSTNETSRGNNDLLKNVYNVDFDFSTYGVGKYKKRIFPPFLIDVADIIILVFGGKLFAPIAKGIGKIGMFAIEKTAAAGVSGFVVAPLKFATFILSKMTGGGGKIAGFYTKFMASSSSEVILKNALGATVETLTAKIMSNTVMTKVMDVVLKAGSQYVALTALTQIPIIVNGVISASARGLMFNKKSLADANSKVTDSNFYALNTSSYIPGVLFPGTSGYKHEIPVDDGTLQTKTSAISFTYENKASLGNILNDMERRYPGAEWEVLESGGFGTIFFGRNNYSYEYVPFAITATPYNNNKATLGIGKLEKKFNISTEILAKLKDPNYTVALNAAVETMNLLDSINLFFTAGSVQKNEENEYTEFLKTDGNLKSKGVEQQGVQYYRNKIYAISGKNLISCAIVTNDNFSNSIKVQYDTSLLGDLTLDLLGTFRKMISKDTSLSDFTLRSFWNLPDHFMRVKEIPKEFSENTNSEYQAREQAAKWMEEEFKEYYDGKIVISYDGDVKRGSEIVICDSINQIYGSVIAKEVSHVADAERGLVTIITPGMKTEFKSPMSSMTLTEIFMKTLQYLVDSNSNKPNDMRTREQIELMNNVIFSENILPITYNFGFDMYYSERGSEGDPLGKGAASSINPISNLLTQPLIVKPLYIKGKLAYPDELIYNAFSMKYDMVRVFWSGIDSMFYQGMMSMDIMGKSIYHSIYGFVTKYARLVSDIWDGRDLSITLAEIQHYDNVGANFFYAQQALKDAIDGEDIYGNTFNAELAFTSNVGTGGFEAIDNIEDFQKVLDDVKKKDGSVTKEATTQAEISQKLLEIVKAEENLSKTDLFSRYKPKSTDLSKIPMDGKRTMAEILYSPGSPSGGGLLKSETRSNIFGFNNADKKRRISYQSLQQLNFSTNVATSGFPLKTWATLNGIAYVHRDSDVLVVTEICESSLPGTSTPNKSMHNRLDLIRKLFRIYGKWDTIELILLKNNGMYSEFYLLLIKDKSKFTYKTVPYTEQKLGIGKSDRNILILKETWGERTTGTTFNLRHYPMRIAFCHTYYGAEKLTSQVLDKASEKGKAFEYFMNIIRSEQIDILMGDLNYEINSELTDTSATRKLPSWFKVKLFDESTTIGGKKYDNALVRDMNFVSITGKKYGLSDDEDVSFEFSDHIGMIVEYDL